MSTFQEIIGEECSICLSTDYNFYLNNVCLCKHLICELCIIQLSKCPFLS